MGMHRHPKYRFASPRQESLMGSDLSYVLPPACISPTVLLVAPFWVALFAWAIWRIWKRTAEGTGLTRKDKATHPLE